MGFIDYLDAVVNNNDGEPEVIKNAICIHEEDAGVLWKHTDWRSGNANTARGRRLVISFFVTIANYDYGFYWYLSQDGAIQLEVKLTGILLTNAVSPDTKSSDLKYSILLRQGLAAAHHQHYFKYLFNLLLNIMKLLQHISSQFN